MKLKSILYCSAALALAASAGGAASAATINLIDLGGVAGSKAELGFKVAAAFWGNLFTNTATINLGVKFAPLDPGVIGSTGSTRTDYGVQAWENRVNSTKSNSTVDQTLVLPTITNGTVDYITNGVLDSDGGTDTDPAKQYYTTNKYAGSTLYLNSSVVKAIGGTINPATVDGNVTFSSTFGFDFDPRDGITAGKFDFIGVAIHEIGHALGFVSGVDFLDVYGAPDGAGGSLGYDLNDTSIFSALDMFRYSNDPHNLAPGDGPVLDLAAGGNATYFSIDGGTTALFGNTMSTGAYNGDGRQASHWKDTAGCQIGNGIMDPTFCYGQTGYITGLDLAAFDAMGWNLSVDALTYQTSSTADALRAVIGESAVPEPASWAMMVGGFGLIGGAIRRRQRMSVAFGQ